MEPGISRLKEIGTREEIFPFYSVDSRLSVMGILILDRVQSTISDGSPEPCDRAWAASTHDTKS
jgi:hypothetical protein